MISIMLSQTTCKVLRIWLLKSTLAALFLVATVQLALLSSSLAGRMLQAVGVRPGVDRSCDNCSHFNFSYVIDNPEFCQDTPRVFLLILVASSPKNGRLRAAIRRTWANVTQHRGLVVKTLFVFGKHDSDAVNVALRYEHERHSDIMQADFRDSYSNLTVKSIVALRWVTTHCRRAQYVLKTDDDAFNNPARYVDILHSRQLPSNAIGGYCFTTRPHREATSRWYVAKDAYPDAYFPVYCGGPAYVMSVAAARAVVRVSRHVHAVGMEDVFVSGLCRLAAGLEYRQIGGVQAHHGSLTPCDLATWVVNVHQVAPPEMARLWGWATDTQLPRTCGHYGGGHIVYAITLAALLWLAILAYIFRTNIGVALHSGIFATARRKRLKSELVDIDEI